ncbi:MAG: hypothetical protein AAGF24_12225 [Cyanobacteria bacterium P01_H01_bin.121]
MLIALLILTVLAGWLTQGAVLTPIVGLAKLGHPEFWLGGGLLCILVWCYGDN